MPKFPIKTVALSSLHKVFPDECPEPQEKLSFSALKNEPLSFQIAYKADDGQKVIPFNVKVETELPIALYCVDYVNVLNTSIEGAECNRGPGLFPDILRPKAINPKIKDQGFSWQSLYFEQGENRFLYGLQDSWQSLWFTVNEDAKGLKPGEYDVKITLLGRRTNEVIGEETVKVKIIGAALPKQKFIYTNWFHCDCLCDYYNVKPFSDEFWPIFKEQVRAAAKNGMNMILTPFFTPALDTSIGSERMTVQLVGVTLQNGEYSFDFSLAEKFIDVCQGLGIEYFEHAHLFTQWGAKAAPKIMGNKNGKYVKLFGWNTKASGLAYKRFLQAYIPALKEFLKKKNIEKKIFFHISDEPSERQAESYKKALAAVGDMLDGYMQGDALSHYVFYENGFVKTPIVVTSAVESFAGRCDNMWCYYTGGEVKDGLSNRLVIMSNERNRILGTQMYKYGMKGFLHWGYNYYYDMLSHGLADPKSNTGCYNANPCTAFSVYPERDGSCLQSIRQKVFFEGILDLRALQVAEKRCGKQSVQGLIEKHFGDLNFRIYPKTPEQMLRFRNELNCLIEKSFKGE